jgi:hypothetical protein
VQRLIESNALKSKLSVNKPEDKYEPEADRAGIGARLAAVQSGEETLPAATRQRMERAFGYGFARVRVHRDAAAGVISRQLGALAFTHRNHIYFRNGMYDPAGSFGKRLLAHELTHVVQQGQASPIGSSNIAIPALALQASEPGIQRVASFEAGAVHEVNNLANTVLKGAHVGDTIALINGSRVLTNTKVRAALKKPTLILSKAPAGGFDAQVGTVPENKGSYDETVLAARRWTLEVPKATVRAAFPDLKNCRGAGKTTFRAFGKPSDPAMFAASRRHEDHHADAFSSAFKDTLIRWDAELDKAAGSGTKFHGSTKAEAKAALHKAMGGTPNNIADAFADTAAAAIDKYHSTPEGGDVSWDPETATADDRCTTSSVDCTNPS